MPLADDRSPIYRRRINDRTGRIMREFRDMHEGRMRGFGWRSSFSPHGHEHEHGPHGRGRGRGRGRGGRRNNVRAAILALLTERPMHGYEMIKEIDTRTGGGGGPRPGSVYPTPQLLEDEGLIPSEESGGRKRLTLPHGGQPQATAAAAHATRDRVSEDTLS